MYCAIVRKLNIGLAMKKMIKSMLHAQRLAKGNLAMSAKLTHALKQMQDDRRMKFKN